MDNVPADGSGPSTYCFCRLFLENMTPMRHTAAKPTPAMPAAITASLTCKREEGRSHSVGHPRTGCPFNKNTQSQETHGPLGPPDNSGVNTYWQGNGEKRAGWGKNPWVEAAGQGCARAQGQLDPLCGCFKPLNPQRVVVQRTRR